MTAVFFATNRNPNRKQNPTDFGATFSPEGLDELRFGWAEVPEDPDGEITVATATERLSNRPPSRQVLGSRAVFEHLWHKMAKHERDTMVYVHGFDFTFREALRRTAELKRWYGANGKPMNWVVFTWPSDGRKTPVKSYRSDRKDAEASGTAMGRGILKAADFVRDLQRAQFCGQRVHLMAHSMGNFALRHAVQGMRAFVGDQLPRLFDEVLLMAADADNDALTTDAKLAPLEGLARRVTTYYNAQDLALVVSDWTKMNPDRLGASGPRDLDPLPPKFININCAAAVDWGTDPTGHQYYRNNAVVRRDVLAVLAGSEDDRIDGRTPITGRKQTYRVG
ncbi:alpha/beta hydrolase [Roseospira navarrensis]|uniref:Alpha/beta hydrolase n=1 Tax=Roseospira navarrensis TaxID=140058 RepID=A0A7X1ZDP2_9PROT|nr:alpha/beta hydrolase [Roseospira navarrensis]MQX36643.1 alpha/beta hydrolase [Roseospira navarrensis]